MKDIAGNPGRWISNLAAAVKDGIQNYLWVEIKTAVQGWFHDKVHEVVGVGEAIWHLLQRGGIAIAEGGRVVEELPLPVAGLMSDRPLAEVHGRLRSMERRLSAMGVEMPAPFMTLSFLALSVIPELKITDQGLVDVGRFELVPLGIE